jgi:hypothetical protein
MGGEHKKHKRTLSAWIDKDKRDALRALATTRGVSVAIVLEELIDERIGAIYKSDELKAGKGALKKSIQKKRR